MLQRFSIWLDSGTIKKLKQISKRDERPIGWIIRKLVEDFVSEKRWPTKT